MAPGTRRSGPRPKNDEAFELAMDTVMTEQYLSMRTLKDKTEAQVDRLKQALLELIEMYGEEEGPHKVITFGEEITGGDYTVRGIKRECRTSQVLDEVAALALITEKGLEDKCLETITVLVEDGLLAANYEKVISDAELAALYSVSQTHAFVLVKK